MQQQRRVVPVDLHAGPEQFLVIGALRVAHQKLVGGLRVDQGHVYPSLRRAGDGRHQCVIGHEVRVGDEYGLARGHDREEVEYARGRRARLRLAQDSVNRERACRRDGGEVRGAGQEFVGRLKPLQRESGL